MASATYQAPSYYKRPTYNTVKYDENKYSKGINTSYYDNAIKAYKKDANINRQQQLSDAQKTQNSALKQAYIQNLQNQRTLNNNLAAAGIRGGATETSMLNLANQYGTARASANSDYANSVNQINRDYNQNIRDYTADMLSRKEEYRQNQMNARWQAAREDALNKYNARNDYLMNKYNAKRENSLNEYNSAAEFWSNYYTDYYSGASKKAANNALKKAQQNYNNAKSSAAKMRYLQQIRGIKARLGVIKNK